MFGYNLQRMAIRLEIFFGAAADTWHRKQAAYNIAEDMKNTRKYWSGEYQSRRGES